MSRLATVATVAAIVAVAAVVGRPSTAAAECSGGGGGAISSGGLFVEAHDRPCAPSGAAGPSYDVERSVRPEPSLCPTTPDALQETFRYYLPGTTTLVRTFTRCVGANIPDPVLPPPPPSALDLFRSAPLPRPEVHINPRVRGLVGLETWLWWGADTTVAPLAVTAGGWSAAIEVNASRIAWDLGNGDVITATAAGTSESDPSITYVYQHDCDCTVTLTVDWSGVVTLTHPLAPAPIVQDVGPVSFSDTFPYAVEEREAVIVG